MIPSDTQTDRPRNCDIDTNRRNRFQRVMSPNNTSYRIWRHRSTRMWTRPIRYAVMLWRNSVHCYSPVGPRDDGLYFFTHHVRLLHVFNKSWKMKPSPATDMRGLRTFSLWTVIRTDGFVPQNYADAMGRGLLYLSIKIWVIQLMFCRNLSDGYY